MRIRIAFLTAIIALALTACKQENITPSQNRVGYSAWRTQVSGDSKIQAAACPGSVETGKWYDVKLTVAGDSVKAWLDNEQIFNDVLKRNTSR